MTDKREETISVSIRIRPLKAKQKDSIVWKKVNGMSAITQVTGDEKQAPVPNSSFQFDNVLDESIQTVDLYNKIGKRIVNSVVDGINGE
jgi:hypothetical protein